MLLAMMVMTISAATPVPFDSMTPEQLSSEYLRLEHKRADLPSARGPAVAGALLFGGAAADFFSLMLFSSSSWLVADFAAVAVTLAFGAVLLVAAMCCTMLALSRSTSEAREQARIDAQLADLRKRLTVGGGGDARGLVPVLRF